MSHAAIMIVDHSRSQQRGSDSVNLSYVDLNVFCVSMDCSRLRLVNVQPSSYISAHVPER